MMRTSTKCYFIFKRIFDVFMSLLSLILMSPLMVLIAVAIKLESPGPLIFGQVRVGFKGKTFRLYKFRTMYVDAENRASIYAPSVNLKRDPRISSSGIFLRKTSLDQLPMFFSVLKGDMSLIGPRPALSYEVEHYSNREKVRLDVLPGITGYAQVCSILSDEYDYNKMLELDLEYVAKASLLLDLNILWKTVLLSIRREIRT